MPERCCSLKWLCVGLFALLCCSALWAREGMRFRDPLMGPSSRPLFEYGRLCLKGVGQQAVVFRLTGEHDFEDRFHLAHGKEYIHYVLSYQNQEGAYVRIHPREPIVLPPDPFAVPCDGPSGRTVYLRSYLDIVTSAGVADYTDRLHVQVASN